METVMRVGQWAGEAEIKKGGPSSKDPPWYGVLKSAGVHYKPSKSALYFAKRRLACTFADARPAALAQTGDVIGNRADL
ncbi:MAG: hypothetical protein Q8S56_06535, partial [Polaromonas sp.]|nr:hypothetical protein [Polaromonas sp.]